MKKLFHPSRYLIILITLTLLACENATTEDPKPINEFGVGFKNGVLQFPTVESYINLV